MNLYGTERGIGFLWHRMDWLMRLDVAVLGLLLVYTIAVVASVFQHYHRVPRELGINSAARRRVAAELNIQVRILESIVTVAPYLGLVGTCFGILNVFIGFGMERHAAVAMMMSRFAAALVPAATGIVVAIPAACGRAYARTRLDLLASLVPRKRLLPKRFTVLPAFALIAAPGLAIVLAAGLTLASFDEPKGFDVLLPSERCQDDNGDRLIVLRITNEGNVFINFEPQEWDTLSTRLSEIYSARMQRAIYLVAEDEVPFQTVADAIDVVYGTGKVDAVRLVTRKVINAPCP